MCAHGGNEASGGIAVHSDWCGAFLVQQKTNEKCFLNTSERPFVKQNLKKKKNVIMANKKPTAWDYSLLYSEQIK